VSWHGFRAGIQVVVVACDRRARHGGGARWCDTSRTALATVSSEGWFTATFTVSRYLRTAETGDLDCGAPVDGCTLAAANTTNYDESGAGDITFSDAPIEFVSMAPSPPGPYADFDLVDVEATGITGTGPLWIEQCPVSADIVVSKLPCVALGDHEIVVNDVRSAGVVVHLHRVMPRGGPGGQEYDCAMTPCSIRLRREVSTPLGVAAIAFDPRSAVVPAAMAEVETTHPIRDGQPARVVGNGFQPGEVVTVAFCAPGFPCPKGARTVRTTVDRNGLLRATITIGRTAVAGQEIGCNEESACHLEVIRPKTWPVLISLDAPPIGGR
jgi:hypothetical protein